MNKCYWIQIDSEMNPVKVLLSDEQVKGVVRTLKRIVEENPNYLCGISDEDGEEIYSNYDEWSKQFTTII